MNELFELENKYLNAKIAYYNGIPFLSDVEFDSLEVLLKSKGSKVHEQVGSKTKDFDFQLPTKMLSLSKIQTELFDDSSTNYMEITFKNWYQKRVDKLGVTSKLIASPKYDGNAIDIVYVNSKLSAVITRGDGYKGKNVTNNLKSLFPEYLIVEFDTYENGTLEIRCEVVIDKKLFETKYGSEFSNPRNYVAGVIGKDDCDMEKILELTPIPLNFVHTGKNVSSNFFSENDFVSGAKYEIEVEIEDYIQTIKKFEELRDDFKFQLDGVVFAFPEIHREILGENSHDPEWATAIKFIPDEAVTSVVGIEWNVGKTGELSPVVLLEPVQLAGTIVKRVSGYNAGYIVKNSIKIGTVLSLHKSGDIIPEISKIIS